MAVDYSSFGFTAILVEHDLKSGVLVVTFNRTAQLNTFNHQLVGELVKVFELADKDDQVRVVVLTADPNGAVFCAGAELSKGWDGLWLPEEEKEGPRAHRDTGGQFSLSVLKCRKITIIAVNGHAAGIGMTMQLPFDFRFMWEGAKLTFPFVRRGIVPEAISTLLLPRLIGHSRATQLLLAGQVLSPNHPSLAPLYYSILPKRGDVFPAALSLAKELAQNTSMLSIAMTKSLLWRGSGNGSPEEQHLLESRTIRSLGQGKDAAEGVKSFMQKRQPNFTGTLGEDLPDWVPWWNEVNLIHRKTKL